MEQPASLCVAHLVDAMGGTEHLWGKERVVELLMREQRASGLVDPILITFSPSVLADRMAADGFIVDRLSSRKSHGFDRTVGELARLLKRSSVDVIHSHGYRSNIVARALRVSGRSRGIGLVSTCHGWDTHTWKLRLYNAIDRWSTVLSDVTTVPDPRMLKSLPPMARQCYVFNGVSELETAVDGSAFVRSGEFIAGTLGRVTAMKGIPDLLAAAEKFPDPSVVFTVAGDGECSAMVRDAGGNVRYVGYIKESERYIAGLDVYVQASHTEGLSLSLLEAMRAGKAIVATDVGATRDAVVHGESALIVPPCRPELLREAVLTLRRDPTLAARLGQNARARFESEFHIDRQHRRFFELYGQNRRAS